MFGIGRSKTQQSFIPRSEIDPQMRRIFEDPAIARVELDVLRQSRSAAAPKTYPDGQQFPSGVHIQNLANVMIHLSSLPLSNRADICGRITLLLMEVGNADSTGPNTDFALAIGDAVRELERLGMAAEAAVMIAANRDLTTYWDQSGATQAWLDSLDNLNG